MEFGKVIMQPMRNQNDLDMDHGTVVWVLVRELAFGSGQVTGNLSAPIHFHQREAAEVPCATLTTMSRRITGYQYPSYAADDCVPRGQVVSGRRTSSVSTETTDMTTSVVRARINPVGDPHARPGYKPRCHAPCGYMSPKSAVPP